MAAEKDRSDSSKEGIEAPSPPSGRNDEKPADDEEPQLYEWPTGDPEHPHNWNTKFKLYISVLLTTITTVVCINSSIYTSTVDQTTPYFGISDELNVLGTTLFLVGYIVGPPAWGPLSERYGRKVPIVTGTFFSGIFTIMAAVAQNAATILIARFLSGTMGAAPVSIVGGAATDNWNAIDRAVALASVIGAVFSGPIMGPIIGDWICQYTSWRWTMWTCAIAQLVLSILAFFTMPETYAPILLARKTKRLRQETGDESIRCARDMTSTDIHTLVRTFLLRPWQLFALEPILVLITLYMGFIYGLLYLFFSSYPVIFLKIRGWDLGISGLPLFGPLIGVVIGTIIVVTFTRTRYARLVRESNGHVAPEQRLPLMIIGAVIMPAGLFWFAWTSDPPVPWPASVIAGGFTGVGMFLIWIQCFTYIIDVYLPVANSALASNGVVRSCFGAGFPLFATQMYENLGPAWASSVLAFLGIAMIPIPVLFYIYGARIRSFSKFTVKET